MEEEWEEKFNKLDVLTGLAESKSHEWTTEQIDELSGEWVRLLSAAHTSGQRMKAVERATDLGKLSLAKSSPLVSDASEDTSAGQKRVRVMRKPGLRRVRSKSTLDNGSASVSGTGSRTTRSSRKKPDSTRAIDDPNYSAI